MLFDKLCTAAERMFPKVRSWGELDAWAEKSMNLDALLQIDTEAVAKMPSWSQALLRELTPEIQAELASAGPWSAKDLLHGFGIPDGSLAAGLRRTKLFRWEEPLTVEGLYYRPEDPALIAGDYRQPFDATAIEDQDSVTALFQPEIKGYCGLVAPRVAVSLCMPLRKPVCAFNQTPEMYAKVHGSMAKHFGVRGNLILVTVQLFWNATFHPNESVEFSYAAEHFLADDRCWEPLSIGSLKQRDKRAYDFMHRTYWELSNLNWKLRQMAKLISPSQWIVEERRADLDPDSVPEPVKIPRSADRPVFTVLSLDQIRKKFALADASSAQHGFTPRWRRGHPRRYLTDRFVNFRKVFGKAQGWVHGHWHGPREKIIAGKLYKVHVDL